MEDILLEDEFDGVLNLKDEIIDVDALLGSGFLEDEASGFRPIKEERQFEDDSSELLHHALRIDLDEGRQIGQKAKRREMEFSPVSFDTMCADSIDGQDRSHMMNANSMGVPQPPRKALTSDLALLHRPSKSENEYLRITLQPPLEIRTRTKNENRTFSCSVQVLKRPTPDCCSATVELCYATDPSVVISTLGGTLTKAIDVGYVNFEDLSVSVASPKHSEKEFMLRITLNCAGKAKTLAGENPSLVSSSPVCVYSTPFYAFSHKSVLKRRREVNLRALSHTTVTRSDSQQNGLHVVGSPFVRSDRLQCVFRLRRTDCDEHCIDAMLQEAECSGTASTHDDGWLSLRAPQLEVFSESVLFFQLPKAFLMSATDIQAFVQVTNDGRNFSNPIPIVYAADAPPSPKRHCTIRSRM